MAELGCLSQQLAAARDEVNKQALACWEETQKAKRLEVELEHLKGQLRAYLQTSPESYLTSCVACNQDIRDVRFPCGHVCMCSECVHTMSPKICPACATPFSSTTVVNLWNRCR